MVYSKDISKVASNQESSQNLPVPEVVKDGDKRHYLVFTGHMIDKPDRKNYRFPATLERNVKEAIKQEVQKEKEKHITIQGIAGGACGGDILFHEVCAELGISTELYLALPRKQFIISSVAFAGPQWIERFDELYKKLPKRVLSKNKELPKWLQKKQKKEYFWERNNLWMLYNSLVCGGPKMSLIALWDGEGGDDEGGTEHMVQQVYERGGRTIIIDINKL